MLDLKIVGATVVDGTGSPRFEADVAVRDGRIVEIGRHVEGGASETIDAAGLLLTPGFVDIHTHYDGQATWDEVLEPSSGHGVTTIVTGNCGVGFAPVRPGTEAWLIQLMEGVEDIPGTALAEGMSWDWETFPEYLDVLEKRRFALDVGTQIAHGAVRAYVMGERGARNEPAGPADIEAMAAIVREAVAAGAFGFSTSRTLGHRAMDGEPCPAPSRPRTSCSAWVEPYAMAGAACSNWLLLVRPARTWWRPARRWSGCDGWPPTPASPCPSPCCRWMPTPGCGRG